MQAHVKDKQIRFSGILANVFFFLNRRKNEIKMLLELCFVPHAQTKSVLTFHLKKL